MQRMAMGGQEGGEGQASCHQKGGQGEGEGVTVYREGAQHGREAQMTSRRRHEGRITPLNPLLNAFVAQAAEDEVKQSRHSPSPSHSLTLNPHPDALPSPLPFPSFVASPQHST